MPIWRESVFPEEAPTIQDLNHRLLALPGGDHQLDTPFLNEKDGLTAVPL